MERLGTITRAIIPQVPYVSYVQPEIALCLYISSPPLCTHCTGSLTMSIVAFLTSRYLDRSTLFAKTIVPHKI